MESSMNTEKALFSPEEKADILLEAEKGSSGIEQTLENVNRITEERFTAKKSVEEVARIEALTTELHAVADPSTSPTEQIAAVDVASLTGAEAEQKMRTANFAEGHAFAERLSDERQEILKNELPWYKRAFRKESAYQETGNTAYTKAGEKVGIVMGPDQKEYIKLTVSRGGGGDAGHQSTHNYYIPIEKAQPFLN